MASDQPPARWKALGSVHARSQETAVTLILALAGIAAAVLLFLILAHVFVRRMSNH
jgi:CHASE1-domain containing sensor protein